MKIEEMRTLLGLGPEISDAAVVQAWAEHIGAGATELADEAAGDDPFATALDAMFEGPGSAAALYTPPGGPQMDDPIRVIRSRPDAATPFGGGQVVQATDVFEIRVSEVAKPEAGGLLQLDSEIFQLFGEPMIDVEGLSHSCGAERLP